MLALVPKLGTYPVLLPEARDRVVQVAARRRRLSPVARTLLAAALVVVPAIAYVHQTAVAARTGYDILGLRQEIAVLRADNARLVAAVTSLRSPDRIERLARHELGMIPPRQTQLVSLALAREAVALQPAPLTWRQRLDALLLRREAVAGESR